MAASAVSRIVQPFPIPSLSHIALIQVTIPLWKEFGMERLSAVIRTIESGKFEGFFGSSNTINNCAKKKLLLIPSLLRKRVWEAVKGLEYAVLQWKSDHSNVFKIKDEECVFYWKFDGSIDRIKTAQQLVLNSKIDVTERFHLACMYCLESSIQTLWAEIEASGKTEDLNMSSGSMVPFWIGRMQRNSQIPWTQAALEYLDSSRMLFTVPNLALVSLFPLLRIEDRQRFLPFLRYAQLDDLRICLYTMTAKEEKLVLEGCAWKVLKLYFQFHLRHLFLEIAEKVLNYINEEYYLRFLEHIVFHAAFSGDFELFEDLWNMSPNNLREGVKRSYITQNVDWCLSESTKKRKIQDEMKEEVLRTAVSDINKSKKVKRE